ncbi:quinolinate synthase NadA [Proteinivorax hydrogeniformans]|uniref:Quinolinate synthase n=1 Tax=Proteinivorax hydrogeniformans TaxID=1826727 RepID=A0AAU8HTB6_9FIRM
MVNSNVKSIQEEIHRLKKEKNAIILGHFYQRPEIQEVADFVGDSFGLSQQAQQTDADVIVFCGVHFMAESAKILSPDKKVILPEPEAGCPMADMADVKQLKEMKKQHPDAAVVAYVNTTAAVKAHADVCCTSANVLKVVQSLPQEKIIYLPDRNMADYLAKKTDKTIIRWPGYCYTHNWLTADDVKKAKEEHPDAKIVVHPECSDEVVSMADKVTGTSGIIKYAGESDAKTFIVGTEMGLNAALKKEHPNKSFVFPSKKLICAQMKANTIEKVYESLKTLSPEVFVSEEIRISAIKALDKMLQVK